MKRRVINVKESSPPPPPAYSEPREAPAIRCAQPMAKAPTLAGSQLRDALQDAQALNLLKAKKPQGGRWGKEPWPKKPTDAQRAAMANIAAGKDLDHGLSGMSAMGGLHNTWMSLVRNGWVEGTMTAPGLTEAGKAALEGRKR